MIILMTFLIASVLTVFFAILLLTAGNQIVNAIIVAKREECIEIVKQATIERNLLVEQMKKRNELKDKKSIKKGKELTQRIEEAKNKYEILESGKLSIFELIPVVGYRAIQLMGWDATNDVIKKMNAKCIQFKEKREAINYTYYIIGSLIGCILLGVCLFFYVLGFCLVFDQGIKSLVFATAAMVAVAIFGYLPYDNVSVVVNDRKEQIENQFPQVVSKLALLTVAGMEVNQAWKLASKSGKGTLYEEMNRVLIDFDNNVPPAEAYSKFMTRCNNNYTTKLATAIMQNLSKGNSEIVALFTQLNKESWLEHKHSARRMGEKISSKLTFPTMLLFVGILIMIIVPVCTGFNF